MPKQEGTPLMGRISIRPTNPKWILNAAPKEYVGDGESLMGVGIFHDTALVQFLTTEQARQLASELTNSAGRVERRDNPIRPYLTPHAVEWQSSDGTRQTGVALKHGSKVRACLTPDEAARLADSLIDLTDADGAPCEPLPTTYAERE